MQVTARCGGGKERWRESGAGGGGRQTRLASNVLWIVTYPSAQQQHSPHGMLRWHGASAHTCIGLSVRVRGITEDWDASRRVVRCAVYDDDASLPSIRSEPSAEGAR